jgi:GGDEF domain-containing protein
MTAFNSGGAQIVDPSIFRVLVEMETRKAQRMRYVVSLVCVGIEHAESAGQALAQRVAPGIRATDAVATQGDDSVTMLLVDAEDSNLPTIMERLRPGLDDVSWSAGGASYPKTAATADALIRQAETMMQRSKQLGGRRLSLAAAA